MQKLNLRTVRMENGEMFMRADGWMDERRVQWCWCWWTRISDQSRIITELENVVQRLGYISDVTENPWAIGPSTKTDKSQPEHMYLFD
ncbi:unnamed protein product [Heligmosomoides polygyrus]|uniref:Uncharacterized protein n=1 Tax=Heligmosomoides polygyrus TaxID=6339 RepID=A0A183GFW7_HELPZ|nr:unnamed protein product [Heligmosomoides polygyrus]